MDGNYEKYFALGGQLGKKGDELEQYIQKRLKQDDDRAEREFKRQIDLDERKAKHDREEHDRKVKEELQRRQYEAEERDRKKQEEAERRDREKQEEAERRQYEAEEREREHQRQMELAQAQAQQQRRGDGGVKAPKLPYFDEDKDCMDAYLRRFERYATSNRWDRGNYASYLSSLLKGKALDVYTKLSANDAQDYDRLKTALLKRFLMTEDGYRRRFYTSRMEREERADQFITRLTDYCDRWIDMAGINKEFEALRDFMVVEQFLYVCPTDVAMHVREKELHDIERVSHAAEVFMTAHRIKPTPRERRPIGQTTTPTKPTTGPATSSTTTAVSKEDKTTTPTERRFLTPSITCFYCQRQGHKASECRQKRIDRGSATAAVDIEEEEEEEAEPDEEEIGVSTCVSVSSQHQCRHRTKKDVDVVPRIGNCNILPENRRFMKRLPVIDGIVNGQNVKVLRDTGCTAAVIRKDLVRPKQFTTKKGRYITVDQTSRTAQFAEVYIESDYYTGVLKFLCIEDPICDVILGNLPEIVRQPHDFLYSKDDKETQDKVTKNKQTKATEKSEARPTKTTQAKTKTEAAMAVTRGQAKKEKLPAKALKVPILPELGSQAEFEAEQKTDPSLHQARKWAEIGKTRQNEQGQEISFKNIKGSLYRRTVDVKTGVEVKISQLCVPQKYRQTVMELGHATMLAGHMGINKTTDRIQSNFYWPAMHDDISRFCKSCDVCQRTIPKGSIPKAPLVNPPIIGKPFTRVAVDIVGPITPPSARKHQYILTLVDMTSRYPKAVPLKRIDTISVAEALLSMFSDHGYPAEILSDRGTQFTSDMMKEVHRLLSIRAIRTSPYHAQCNGLCEKYNGTLKKMLRRMVQEQPTEWDRFIEPLLFAYREVPISSLGGFSPFEVLLGHTVRGPMSVLRELWTEDEIEDEVKDAYEYVLDLRNRLKGTCQLVADSLKKAQDVQKTYFDKKAKRRVLKTDDEVLVMLPTDSNKLLMKWRGPYTIKEKLGENNYLVAMDGRDKVFHINMLKQYFRPEVPDIAISVAAITFEDDEAEEITAPEQPTKKETFEDVNINPNLPEEKITQLKDLIEEFQDIFSSIPGRTNLGEHRIDLTDDTPVRCKSYPVPYALYDDMEKEIRGMLEMGIIEPSDSPYNSPIVIVKKKDGTMRYCQDMRQLNKITRFDCESIPDIDAIYTKCAKDKYFSKIDFCKGYWQIPMEEESKKFTAFQTPFGHYQYLMMPFGLMNSGQTYSRVARRLLRGLKNVDNFIDDVLTHTMDWLEHLSSLRALFESIRDSSMRIRPTKCYFGYEEVGFTGHDLAAGELRTQCDKTEKIKKAEPPTTKKQLRSFLGLAGFYRRFIPKFAEKAKPLTDLTGKGQPEKVQWQAAQQAAFDVLREELCSEPILRLPDLKREFVLRTDASDIGLGAVLMQEHDGTLFPCVYISRKLLPRERNYSVIERECLAVVWAVDKLVKYLYGAVFVLQTDHESLKYLQRAKFDNQRVMRWALLLQPYKYRVEYIKGCDNLAADFLSRSVEKDVV